jgi:hypothetical protein
MRKKSGRITGKVSREIDSVNAPTCKWTMNVRIAVIGMVIFAKQF